MKRRRRRNLIGRTCGVVAVVFLLLWYLGKWYGNVAAASPGGHWGVWLHRSEVQVYYSKAPVLSVCTYGGVNEPPFAGLSDEPTDFASKTGHVLADVRARALGATRRWSPSWSDSNGHGWQVLIPWCIPALPFAFVAVITERRHQLRLRLERRGKCRNCGYDRAGIALSAVCPECGKAP